jgi:hypothetical protein
LCSEEIFFLFFFHKKNAEQLEKSQKEMKRVDQMLDQSEYLLRGIKSIGGAISNAFRKVPVVDSSSTPRSSAPSSARNGVPATAMTVADSPDGVLVRQGTGDHLFLFYQHRPPNLHFYFFIFL